MSGAIWHAARQELTRARRRSTSWLAGALVMSLLGCSFLLEIQRQRDEAREQSVLQEQVSEEWKRQPDRHPHRMAHYGSFAFRQPSALSFFDPGIEPFTGNAVYLEAHKRNTPILGAAAQSSELMRFGRPTAAFMLQWLLPLLIFCMSFDSVAGEREAGTWALALAQGAPVRALMAGKIVGQWLLVAGWVVPPLVLAAVWQLCAAFDRDAVMRACLLLLCYVVYLGLCAGLGVVVSSLHARARGALTSLLCLWFACWIVIPRAATELAARTHPVASRAQLELELSRASQTVGNGHGRSSPEAKALIARTLAQYGVARVEELPVNVNGMITQLGEERTSALYDRFYRQMYAAQRAQAELTLRFGVLTPALLVRAASMALAGSDSERYQDFLEQAERHRFAFIAKLNALHTAHLHYDENDRLQRASRANWATFEAFHYRQPSLSAQSPLWRSAMVGLLAWCGALAVLVWMRRERAV